MEAVKEIYLSARCQGHRGEGRMVGMEKCDYLLGKSQGQGRERNSVVMVR
jgi:hypothetical protein